MGFLNILKKKEKSSADLGLDLPPEPPKNIGEDLPMDEPVDEELMVKPPKPKKNVPKSKKKKDKLPELPPLPEEDELDIPPLPIDSKPDIKKDELDLPPPPLIQREEKKGLFSFLKSKKKDETESLPKIEEEMPELPKEDIPPLPPLDVKEEMPPLPMEEKMPDIPVQRPLDFEEHVVPKEVMPEVEEPAPIQEMQMPIPREISPKAVVKQKFITINEFQSIQGSITELKVSLKSIDSFFGKSEENKPIVEKEYSELNNSLYDIHKKIMFIDKNLFKEAA
ncbi:MAG: hypothetical protein U9O94_11740 [Nanoarchaeota archaeon]|nr:hypothetical protein [Nanoarchaeota archaeon]